MQRLIQRHLQDHLGLHPAPSGCLPGARMRRGLPDQHLLDHPGLDSWYHPRDVRVMSSPENLRFSITNHSTVISSLNTRDSPPRRLV